MYRQFRSRRQWRKWISAAELEWSKVHAKLHGGILFNKLYFLDDQDTNPANTQRLFLRHGRYKNFRVHATACTFSSTILVDQLGDESCYLVDIARVNFMEAEGARERPLAIQYLSFQCDISPLVLSSGSSEVTKVHVRYFLQTAKTSSDSIFLTSSDIWCGGGLVRQRRVRESRALTRLSRTLRSKPRMRYDLTQIK